MKVQRYSRWDGSQEPFALDAEDALQALSDLMMHGLSARDALDAMRAFGFELAGQSFRVMGERELLEKMRAEARKELDRHHLRNALDEPKQRFEELLDREQATVLENHGHESRKLNDFLERRHDEKPERLSDRIERFDHYDFEDPEAAEEYQSLRAELERMRQLEKFIEQYGKAFRGKRAASYEEAQDSRERISRLEQSVRALREGRLEQIDPEQLRELLGPDAARSLLILRDLEPTLRDAGLLRTRDERDELTPAAVRRIGAHALAALYGSLRKGRPGMHETKERGGELPRPDETRPYAYGDGLDVDVVQTALAALGRSARAALAPSEDSASALGPSSGEPTPAFGRMPELTLEDLSVRVKDCATHATTVLLLDLSWSMSFDDRFPAAKRVALALDQLIRTQFPRDHFFVVGFSTRARELGVHELPEVTWDPSDPFTNLQEGLRVAERLIARHPSPSPQILVITDGQPTAYFVGSELHVEWPSGRGGISPRAVAQTLAEVKRITQRGITINTFMLHDSPELVGFVERMTEINRGRALFTDPEHLGAYVLVDHLRRRRAR